MARWGEGDPRWIVEERPDAINVNNWHWTEKEASPWSRETFDTLFINMIIEDGSHTSKIESLGTIQGEACINNRKAKLIFIYDWDIELKFAGKAIGQEKSIYGIIRVPNLSDENDIDEIDVSVTVNDDDKKSEPDLSDSVKQMIRTIGTPLIRAKCEQYVKMLKNEFSGGVILPTKTTNDKTSVPIAKAPITNPSNTAAASNDDAK